MQRLDRLVGTWQLSGEASGTVTSVWMPGGQFLLQHVDLDHAGHRVQGMEVVGHLHPLMGERSEHVHSRFYGSEGETLAREEADARLVPVDHETAVSPEQGDDSLVLLFLCAHPALPRPAQVALTLRAVGGLSTAEIAAAFLVPDSTMGQRITRAKQTIRRSGVPFRMPSAEQRPTQLAAVLQVLYLIFNPSTSRTATAGTARRLPKARPS
ncbi:MAG: sigma factor-like helix-turn-helix DNA-binding protein [Pseudonocardiaceae bacterium]